MSFGEMPQRMSQVENPMEFAKQKFGVDLGDDTAVRRKAIELAVDSPEAMELLKLWDAHQKNEHPS